MSKTKRKKPRSQPQPTRQRKSNLRISRLLGSLQMAVTLLPLFAAALFLGTLVESWYDGKVARQLVYGTWWFATLLGLLGVTIFFAAIKKRPWKKHQTGFLITHVGLLCLVAGGLINSLSGVSAMMVMVDSDSAMARSFGRHQSSLLIDRSVQSIQVQRLGKRSTDLVSLDFRPGIAAWHADDDFRPSVDGFPSLLNTIAHPFPRRWSYNLDAHARLEVLNYYPHAHSEMFGPDKQRLATSFPAIQFQLSSPSFGELPRRWTAYRDGSRTIRMGSGLIEILAINCRPEQIEEFQNPPRIAPASGDRDDAIIDDSVKGLLQFVTDQDGHLYYRTFSGTASSGLEFEQSGQISDDESQLSIWKRKNWTLHVTQFLPYAQPGPFFVPVNRRVGLEDDRTPPAIRCRLSTSQGQRDFWLGKADGEFETVTVGDEQFLVGYNSKLLDLEFELTLLRAEQTLDRGSTQPASQSSYVLLDDPAMQIDQQARMITLNNPLAHRGYKIFQSQYRSLGLDDNSRPISQAVLIVSRDPGVRLKYAGSVMLAIGIACMFYMRAYFFKPRAPVETKQEAVTVGEATHD